MRRPLIRRLGSRIAVAVSATGLAVAGLVLGAAPASAAACSGISGVTVVVDTGGSISTACASGDPSSAWKALTAAGFGTTPVQTFPGALCQINGYPDTSCVRMPPAGAYWAFFHAPAGGSWTYSSTGIAGYDPAPGTVVGFRFGSGGQPGIAPPAPKATSRPAPTTARPTPTTAAPRPTTAAPRPTSKPAPTSPRSSRTSTAATQAPGTEPGTTAQAGPTASTSAAASATPTPSASSSADPPTSDTPGAAQSSGAPEEPTPLAAAPTAGADEGSSGPGTLALGAALVALVGGGAGWAAWRRRV